MCIRDSCMILITVWHWSLCNIDHCVTLITVWYWSLYDIDHCVTSFTVWHWSLYYIDHCVTFITMWHSSLYDIDHCVTLLTMCTCGIWQWQQVCLCSVLYATSWNIPWTKSQVLSVWSRTIADLSGDSHRQCTWHLLCPRRCYLLPGLSVHLLVSEVDVTSAEHISIHAWDKWVMIVLVCGVEGSS